MWISDIKEVYYAIVSAWQMLNGLIRIQEKKEINYVESCKTSLSLASSRFGQSLSELDLLHGKSIQELKSDFRSAYERCSESIQKYLKMFEKDDVVIPPEKVIEKLENDEYHLRCAECGKIAVILVREKLSYRDEMAYAYKGILNLTFLRLELIPTIRVSLDANDLKSLHQYLRKMMCYEGIDAYCPECNTIYCRKHYVLRETWDEGFYDCTYGTCPKNHTRIVHD